MDGNARFDPDSYFEGNPPHHAVYTPPGYRDSSVNGCIDQETSDIGLGLCGLFLAVVTVLVTTGLGYLIIRTFTH